MPGDIKLMHGDYSEAFIALVFVEKCSGQVRSGHQSRSLDPNPEETRLELNLKIDFSWSPSTSLSKRLGEGNTLVPIHVLFS